PKARIGGSKISRQFYLTLVVPALASRKREFSTHIRWRVGILAFSICYPTRFRGAIPERSKTNRSSESNEPHHTIMSASAVTKLPDVNDAPLPCVMSAMAFRFPPSSGNHLERAGHGRS